MRRLDDDLFVGFNPEFWSIWLKVVVNQLKAAGAGVEELRAVAEKAAELGNLPRKAVMDYLETLLTANGISEDLAETSETKQEVEEKAPEAPQAELSATKAEDKPQASLPVSQGSGDKGNKEPRRSQAELIGDMLRNRLAYWLDQYGRGWITVLNTGEHLQIGSTTFKKWVSREFNDRYGKFPNNEAIQAVRNVLEGRADRERRSNPVFVRVAHEGDAIFLDLGDEEHRAVRITAHGWDVVESEDTPVFERLPNIKKLPLPVKGSRGAIDYILEPWSLNERDRLLVKVWLLSTLTPGPYGILVLNGEQGSGKTTLSRVLKGIIDPGDVGRLPRETRDLYIDVRSCHVAGFDNLSRISDEISDSLCVVATGGELRVRQLYTNDEPFTVHVKNPLILNGVTDFVTRPDLADRCITINLQPPDGRLRETEILERLKGCHAEALGELLDLAVEALKNLANTPVPRERLADVLHFAVAAGLRGDSGLSVLEAYREMKRDMVTTIVDEDVLTAPLKQLLEQSGGRFEGSAQEILEALNSVRPEGRPPEGWPHNPRAMTAWLQRMTPALRAVGVDVRQLPRSGKLGKRGWSIISREIGETTVRTVRTVSDTVQHEDSRLTVVSSTVSPTVSTVSRPSAKKSRPGQRADGADGSDGPKPYSSEDTFDWPDINFEDEVSENRCPSQ